MNTHKPSPEWLALPGVTLPDLRPERLCRWPLGHPDAPDFRWCGDPVAEPGKPFTRGTSLAEKLTVDVGV